MKRKIAGASFIIALLFSVVCLMFVGLAGANPLPAPPILEIYIRSDGTVDPATVPIQREGNIYTFASDLTNSTITVECDNIVIDGAGFKLQGNGEIWNTGLTLTNRSNVIIKNLDVRHYWKSITLTECSGIIIFSNNMLTSWNILLDASFRNQIIGNNITGEDTGFGYCIHIENGAADNLIVGNNFVDAGSAVTIYGNSGGNNTFYHNNFINNKNNVGGWIEDEEANVWDNGKEGNYWSDYNDTDADGDGVGDTPYLIHEVRPDPYPLMVPFDVSGVTVGLLGWMSPPSLDVVSPENVTYTADVALDFTVNKQTSWLGYSLDGADVVAVSGNITLSGLSSGLHNVTVYAEDMFGNSVTSETVYFTIAEEPEPFPVVPVVAASGASIVVVVVGLLFYFRKRSH